MSLFLLFGRREQEGEKERVQDFFLQSSEFRWSEFVETRVKVHLLNEDYAYVPKNKDFAEDPKEEIWGKSKFSGLGGVLETFYHSTTLQKVGVLPTLVYF